jgi:AcrR family transcriptional regulator
MARVVDHDERRAHLIEVAARLIAKSGMDGLTVREVAKAAGVSTGVVSHYFADKRDLLKLTFDVTADSVYGQVAEQLARDGHDPEICLEGFLPIDAERRRGWRVWLAFWGLAIGDREFAADQKLRARRARDLVARILRAGRDAGELRPEVDIEAAAALVLGVVQGIAAQATFDPKDWPPERQRQVLAAALRPLRVAI